MIQLLFYQQAMVNHEFTSIYRSYLKNCQVKNQVLVISPLQALMKDQISKLEQLNISATVVGEFQPDKGVVENIAAGKYSIVFSSPEAALTPGLWRTSLTKGQFHSQIKAVVIDEAHCITQWGGEFRRHYDRLAELRSVVPEKLLLLPLQLRQQNPCIQKF